MHGHPPDPAGALRGSGGPAGAPPASGPRGAGAAAPEHKLEETAWADYEIALEDGDSQGLQEAVTRLLGREALLVKKHTKKGEREIDIKSVFAGTEVAPRPGGCS